MRALIVGAGTMGQWFAELTQAWLTCTFLDPDDETAREAVARFDTARADPESVASFPIVCTAVPLAATQSAIARYGGQAEKAVIDLSGSMDVPLQAMRSHAPDCERISLHPLFAPENAPGNVATVIEDGDDIADRIQTQLKTSGYTPFETTIDAHDRAMETVQTKVHAAAIAYALAAEPVDPAFHTPVSSRMATMVDLVLEGNPRVYADIQAWYAGADDFAEAAAQVAGADDDEFIDLYREASARQFDSSAEHG